MDTRRRLALGACLVVLVVGCDPAPPDSSAPSSPPPSPPTSQPPSPSPTPLPTPPPTPPPPTPPPDDDPDPAFTVASFNALGANHTAPGGKRVEWPSGEVRARGMLGLLRRYRPDVLGVQEFQRAQRVVVRRRTAATYGVFGDLDNSVMWRRSAFVLVRRTTLTIPYFYGAPRRMPVVRLRHRDSGRVVTVLNVHNPASVRGDAARWRDEAVARERAFAARERARGRVVLVIGDLNDRDEAFCRLAAGGLLVAANGGDHTGGVCTPPADSRIDWIFGGGVGFDDYVYDTSTRGDEISDHPFVVATATLAGRARS